MVTPDSRTTRKSTSLSGRFSPVATDPNTRTFRQPRISATRTISALFSRRKVSSVTIIVHYLHFPPTGCHIQPRLVDPTRLVRSRPLRSSALARLAFVERASRLPCRYSYRHASKKRGQGPDVG